METISSSPLELRQHARRLDDTATRLESSLVMTLPDRADERIWRGALATTCRNDLDEIRRLTAVLVATLRTEAREFQRRAIQLEWVPP